MKDWEKALGLEPSDPSTAPVGVVAEMEDQLQEQQFHVHEVEEAARNDLDFLAALAMPQIYKYFYPDLFKQAWAWLSSYVNLERDFSQLALGLPRGFSKTTFTKIFLLYVILFTKKQFILVCANSVPKAVAIVADVMDFLLEPNIQKVFGDYRLGLETDQAILKKFGFRGRNITISAGTVESVRGLNIKHQRPDIMVFDDIQSRQDAESEVISKQIETDMIGTAMKAKSPHGCLFIFVGNMYPTKWSILRRLKHNPAWTKFIVGGILSSGESLWEELQPISQLLKEFQNDLRMGRPEIFYAEVLNDENASVNNLIDLTRLPKYSIPEDEIHQGNFIIIDPANDKANSDSVSIMYFEVHNATPVCKWLKEERLSPGDTILEALKIALTRNCRVIAIESNAYQYTLQYWFNYICTQRGIIGIEAVEVYSGSYSKNSRVLTMFKQLLAGEILVHPECAAQVNLQITQFNPLKRDNTDGLLDCLAYATKVLEMYEHLIAAFTVIVEQSIGDLPVLSQLENSPF